MRGRATYVKQAVVHPYNLPLLVLVVATSLIGGSILVLSLGLAAELVVLSIVPRMKAFRRQIDEMYEEIDREEAAKTRTSLLLQMDEDHRVEFEKLESLVDRIRENVWRRGLDPGALLDECIGLGKLTTSYVRLAITYKASKDSLSSASRQGLQNKIDALAGTEVGPSERLRKLARRRLIIAHKRMARWDQTQHELEAIGHQLSAIVELIHLMHEQSVTPIDPQGLSDQIDQVMADLDGNEGMLREMAELSVADEVDAEVLELGRTRVMRSA